MKPFIVLAAVTIFDAIETLQVGARLRVRNGVIRRNRIFHKPQVEHLHHSTLLFQHFRRFHNRFFYFRIQTISHVIFRDSDLHSLHIIYKSFRETIIFSCNGCAVFRIVRRDRLQKCRTVRYIFCNRSDLIKGRSVCHKSVSRYGSVRWFQSHHAAVGTGLTDRSTGIRSQRSEALARCHCRAGSA